MAAYEELFTGTTTYQLIADYLGVSIGTAIIILAIISIWTLVWKGIALWKSSRKNSLAWFIILLIVNGLTLGILEILYIYVFSEIGGKKKTMLEKSLPKKKK